MSIKDILPDDYIKGARTKELDISVECCRYANPIYLRWKNEKGGIDYWMFDKENSYNPEVNTISKYERPLQNIRKGDKLRVVEKNFKEVWVCNTSFEKENLNGMKQLLSSECIEFYKDNEFITVDVELITLKLLNTAPFGKMTIKIIFAKNER